MKVTARRAVRAIDFLTLMRRVGRDLQVRRLGSLYKTLPRAFAKTPSAYLNYINDDLCQWQAGSCGEYLRIVTCNDDFIGTHHQNLSARCPEAVTGDSDLGFPDRTPPGTGDLATGRREACDCQQG